MNGIFGSWNGSWKGSGIFCVAFCGRYSWLKDDRVNGFRLIPLLITIGFQMFIMRDIEKMMGWMRIGLIYMISGIAGSLCSAIFLPYHPEVSHS